MKMILVHSFEEPVHVNVDAIRLIRPRDSGKGTLIEFVDGERLGTSEGLDEVRDKIRRASA